MSDSILIVDTLSFFILILITTKFRSTRKVFYLHQNKGWLVSLAIKILERCGWFFTPIEYTLSPVNGSSLYKELGQHLIKKIKTCREDLFPPYIDILTGISEYERKRLSTYYGILAGAELYSPMLLYILSIRNFMLGYKIETVLLKKTVFSSMIDETYRSANLHVYFYRSFSRNRIFVRQDYEMDRVIVRIIGSYIESFSKTAAFICSSLFYKIVWGFLLSKKTIKKHKICALVFNRYPSGLFSCVPWSLKESDYLKKETLILAPSYLPDSAKKFYKDRSDRFIEYSFNPFCGNKDIELIKAQSRFINLFFKNIRIYQRFFGCFGIRRWISKYLLEMLTYLSFFEAIFEVNGSKILWTSMPDYPFLQMAAMAINRKGGVSLGSSFSQAALPEWGIQHNQVDVYFAWGKRLVEVLKDNYDQCKFFVLAGYPLDAIFADEFKKAQDFRNLIFKQFNAKNIITFIDNAPANDSFIAPQTLFELYDVIFSWLRENQQNFCIIKSKRGEIINRYLELKKRIEYFCQKGQISIRYERAAVYPSWAADVTISPSLSLLSVSALLGKPCIYYDVHQSNSDYALGLDNIQIVSKKDELRQVLIGILESNGIGGFPQRLELIKGSVIDPFTDGKSIHRIREYLSNLLGAFNMNSSSAEAIKGANENHKMKWGNDSVISGPLEA